MMGSSDGKSGFIVPLILVTGVVVGLVLVISVIFCCKYCLNKNRHFQRKSHFWSRISAFDKAPLKSRDPDSQLSTGSADPSTIHTSSSNKQSDTCTTTSECLKVDNEIDAAVAAYKERCKSFDGDLENASQHDSQPEKLRSSSVGDTSGSDISRHVSFVITDENATTQATPKQSPPKNRYTEGDFHHLKSARIDRPSLSKLRNISGSGSSEKYDPGGSFNDDVISEATPMLSPVCEEVGSTKTQVHAEVHRDPNGSRVDGLSIPSKILGRSPVRLSKRDTLVRQSTSINDSTLSPRHRDHLSVDKIKHPKHTLAVMKESGKDRHAWSLELVSPEQRWPFESRRVKSYEEDFVQKRRDNIDYDRSLITQFSGDFGVTVASLSPECPTTKARYNDIGSFEDISDSQLMEEVVLSESETINGTHKYKELWNLRSTLESEEVDDDNISDTLRMEIMSSPDEMSVSSNRDHIKSLTTSFESNTEPVADPSQSGTSEQCSSEDTVIMKGSVKLLHPNYESRRHTYQSMFSNKKKPLQCVTDASNKQGGENSFDSLETMDTDGDVSESSRQEFTTTSFESTGTTDNTDSTGDSASHKLQQMRGDSGYKSLETQQSQTHADVISLAQHSKAPKKQIHFVFDDETVERVKGTGPRSTSLPETHTPSRHQYSRSHYFDRRGVKTASKKRREFRSDRKQFRLQQGIQEGESDSKSDQPSGDSFEEAPKRERMSFLNKIMKTRSNQSPKKASLSRDFSIDEKTDAVFNEFLRHDPHLDNPSASKSSPQMQRLKFQRKSSEAFDVSTRPKHRLSKGSRSASVDQSNIAVIHSLKKLSPQDSIEEQSIELDITKPWSSHDVPLQSKTGSSKSILKTEKRETRKSAIQTSKQDNRTSKSESKSPKHSSSKSIPKIPIIKLNTESTEV